MRRIWRKRPTAGNRYAVGYLVGKQSGHQAADHSDDTRHELPSLPGRMSAFGLKRTYCFAVQDPLLAQSGPLATVGPHSNLLRKQAVLLGLSTRATLWRAVALASQYATASRPDQSSCIVAIARGASARLDRLSPSMPSSKRRKSNY